MRTGFIHIADVHLGTDQYGSPERADDFGRQWHRFAQWAVEHRDQVSMALVAGDLFNRYNVDPETYGQAKLGLRLLKEAGIPVLDVEGNHDRHRRRGAKTWLEDLAEEGLVYLLDVDAFETEPQPLVGGVQARCRLSPVSKETGWGSYFDLDGVRVLGLRYMGASTSLAIDALARSLDELPKGGIEYTVLLLHAGLEGIIPQMNAELLESDLAKLEERVDYLALGHIHKQYQESSWVFNPGSAETWRADEARWPHGFYHVSVDTRSPSKHLANFIEPPRRLFLTVGVDVSRCASPTDLYRLAEQQLQEARQRHPRARPVVHLLLEGTLRFDRRDIDYGLLLEKVDEVFKPIARKLSDHSQLPDFALSAGLSISPGIDRRELELSILTEVNRADERYRPHADAIARLAVEVMSRASDEPGETVGQRILDEWRAIHDGELKVGG